MRIPIPNYVKVNVKLGLELRKKQKNPSSLTASEAKKLGIVSGVSRARQLRDNQTISVQDAKSIRNFLSRFKNSNTERSKVAKLLWGDDDKDRFRKYLNNILSSME